MQSETILVVDDSIEIKNLLCDLILKPTGYEVLTVSNGRGAIRAARQYCPHLIMLDINLPDMHDGMVFWISNSGGGGFDLKVIKPDAGFFLVSNGQCLMIACDSSNWHQVINA